MLVALLMVSSRTGVTVGTKRGARQSTCCACIGVMTLRNHCSTQSVTSPLRHSLRGFPTRPQLTPPDRLPPLLSLPGLRPTAATPKDSGDPTHPYHTVACLAIWKRWTRVASPLGKSYQDHHGVVSVTLDLRYEVPYRRTNADWYVLEVETLTMFSFVMTMRFVGEGVRSCHNALPSLSHRLFCRLHTESGVLLRPFPTDLSTLFTGKAHRYSTDDASLASVCACRLLHYYPPIQRNTSPLLSFNFHSPFCTCSTLSPR